MAKAKHSAVSRDTARQVKALTAKAAQLEGKKLTRQQLRDVDWFDKLTRARHVEEWLQAVPKKDYCALAGRQHKLIDDAAENYDLPLSGATVHLGEVLKAFHDFMATHAHKLRGVLDGTRDELETEKLRHQIIGIEFDNQRKQVELAYSRGDAIPKTAVREALVALSAQLRTLGQTLERIHPDARDALNNLLETLASEIENGQFSF